MELTVWIVITGDPIYGYTHYGPFTSKKEAEDGADKITSDNFWICALEHPDDHP